jgi:hypothetical protein
MRDARRGVHAITASVGRHLKYHATRPGSGRDVRVRARAPMRARGSGRFEEQE